MLAYYLLLESDPRLQPSPESSLGTLAAISTTPLAPPSKNPTPTSADEPPARFAPSNLAAESISASQDLPETAQIGASSVTAHKGAQGSLQVHPTTTTPTSAFAGTTQTSSKAPEQLHSGKATFYFVSFDCPRLTLVASAHLACDFATAAKWQPRRCVYRNRRVLTNQPNEHD